MTLTVAMKKKYTFLGWVSAQNDPPHWALLPKLNHGDKRLRCLVLPPDIYSHNLNDWMELPPRRIRVTLEYLS